MTQEQFHQAYEKESGRVYSELSSLTEDQLWEIISDKNESTYKIWKGKDNYQIWGAVQLKGSEKSIKPLYEIVSDLGNDYLVRYHACTALFHIARINDNNFKGQVQYGIDKNRKKINQQKAINKLTKMLKKYLSADSDTQGLRKKWWQFW